ncbi:hypothetical protein ABEB36_004465 [Hypothenemus hampei]|uniref:Uncharacterized protein n=1 Tax=Hypothenemus hampei TaxID=57062 RepID=A0ABD1F3F7_HYPHA
MSDSKKRRRQEESSSSDDEERLLRKLKRKLLEKRRTRQEIVSGTQQNLLSDDVVSNLTEHDNNTDVMLSSVVGDVENFKTQENTFLDDDLGSKTSRCLNHDIKIGSYLVYGNKEKRIRSTPPVPPYDRTELCSAMFSVYGNRNNRGLLQQDAKPYQYMHIDKYTREIHIKGTF